MNTEQITNIGIKIGEIQQKADFSVLVALISFVGVIVGAFIAGIFAYKNHLSQKQHEKQWAYHGKKVQIIDSAIEILSRMLFNKLIVASQNDPVASQNLFILQKDALVIECQMAVYGFVEVADAIADFKYLIINTPNSEFITKWTSILDEGKKCLFLIRQKLAIDLTQKYADFAQNFKNHPPSELPQNEDIRELVKADSMGGMSKII